MNNKNLVNNIMNYAADTGVLKRIIYGIIYVLFFSQSVKALDLSDMVADSISAHPQVKEKVHVYRQVLRDQSIAKSGWKPSIDLQASTGLYDTESPATGNSSVDYDHTRIELSVTQNLFNGYDTTHQVEQTKSRARAALFDVYDTADNIALDSIKAYLEVLKQKQLHVLAMENVHSHEGILSQIRERNSSGVGRRSQLQQTEGRVARAHASLIAQQNNLQDASTLLHQVLGRYVDPENLTAPLLPELPPNGLNSLIDQALEDHPAMKVAVNNISASQSDYSRSKSTNYPNVDLRLASEFGNDIGGIPGDTKETSLVLNLTYNFYNGGADESEQLKRISAVHEQKEFSARVRRQVINTLRLSWIADESLMRQLEYLETHTVKAKETVESYREEFFIGQRDLIDLLDGENELNTARNQHAEAYYDLLAARYRIYEATGNLFEALNLDSNITEDNLTVARISARDTDSLPLPTDQDIDREKDETDHCDNSLTDSEVNVYGCRQDGQVELGFVQLNSAPVVGNDELELDRDSILVISRALLLANDTDADNDVLKIVDVGRPANGRLALDKNKNLIYRPTEGFSGVDSFTYSVSDGNGATAIATVSLLVKAVVTHDLSKMQYVNFKYNQSVLTANSETLIKEIIQQIRVKGIAEKNRENESISIEIYTYTDSIGSDRYNLALSERRAQALEKLLVQEGINRSFIKARGMGEKNPIADNSTKAGQAINRRGEFFFMVEEVPQ